MYCFTMTEETLKQIYGRNIKLLREQAKLTQAQLAEKIGLAEKYLSALERGANWGSFATLISLANAFGVEPYELLLPQNHVVNYNSRRTKLLMSRFRTNLNELVDTVEDFLEEK